MRIYQIETGDTVDLAAIDGISALVDSCSLNYKTFRIFLNGSSLEIEIKDTENYIYSNLINTWIAHKTFLEKQYLNSADIDL